MSVKTRNTAFSLILIVMPLVIVTLFMVLAGGTTYGQSLPVGTRVITVSKGTTLPVRMEETVFSKDMKPGQYVYGKVAVNVIEKDVVVIPQGTRVVLRVVSAIPASSRNMQMASLSIEAVQIDLEGATADPVSVALVSNLIQKSGSTRSTAAATSMVSSALWRMPGSSYYNGMSSAFSGVNYVDASFQLGELVAFSLGSPIAISRCSFTKWGAGFCLHLCLLSCAREFRATGPERRRPLHARMGTCAVPLIQTRVRLAPRPPFCPEVQETV